MASNQNRVAEQFANLYLTMGRLRDPNGCRWDRAQDLKTLRAYLLEETYELLESMEGDDPKAHCEELGDLLFQAVFQARIREEQGAFDLADVAQGIREKLERRHPHVFGQQPANISPQQVRQAWEQIKRKEKQGRALLDGIPREMPALLQAVRIGEKAAHVGFDWPDTTSVREKINEELDELDEVLAVDRDRAEQELGDLLFALCSWARHNKLQPEDALRGSLQKFRRRFAGVEQILKQRGLDAADCELDVLEEMWQQAKGKVG